MSSVVPFVMDMPPPLPPVRRAISRDRARAPVMPQESLRPTSRTETLHQQLPVPNAFCTHVGRAVAHRRPLVVGNEAARRVFPDGVWVFLPYGSAALRQLEAKPAFRLGFDGAPPPGPLTQLPVEILLHIADALPVRDLFALAATSSTLHDLVWHAAQQRKKASAIVHAAWQSERNTRQRQRLFSLPIVHPLQYRVFPFADTFYLGKETRGSFANICGMVPNITTLDASALDDGHGAPESMYKRRADDALLCWPSVHTVRGNKIIAHALAHLQLMPAVMRTFVDVGTCQSAVDGQRSLAPICYDGERLRPATLMPWLKPHAGLSDPYVLLDLCGIRDLAMALVCADGLAPRPERWLLDYANGPYHLPREEKEQRKLRTNRRVLRPFRVAPVFYTDDRRIPYLRPELRSRIPGFDKVVTQADAHAAAQIAPHRMVHSDAKTLTALCRAILWRLEEDETRREQDKRHQELQTLSLQVALPFFSFACHTLPVLHELQVQLTEGQLLDAIWHHVWGDRQPSSFALMRAIAARAPGFSLSFVTVNNVWRLKTTHIGDRVGWSFVPTRESLPVRQVAWERRKPTVRC